MSSWSNAFGIVVIVVVRVVVVLAAARSVVVVVAVSDSKMTGTVPTAMTTATRN